MRTKLLSCNATPHSSPRISPGLKRPKTISNQVKLQPEVLTSNQAKSLLKDLTTRTKVVSQESITSDTAVSVVKSYILPMFEKDYRKQSEKKRFSIHNRKFSADASSVYGELKLSEKLSNEKEELLRVLRINEGQMRENFQNFEVLKRENAELRSKVEELKTNLEFFMFENQKLRVEVDRITFSLIFAAGQYGKFKNMFDRVKKENENYSKELHSLNVINDIRLLFFVFFNSCK